MGLPTSTDADRRAELRTSLYLAASLYCDGSSMPVKIRNIAASGALLDTATTLTTGSSIQLARGSLIVHGLVSWSANCRCGIKFSGSVDVQLWRASPVSAEQQRIDDLVGVIKTGAVELDGVTERGEDVELPDLAQDLQRAVKLLANCADRLAQDGIVVASYASELQNLDIAMQLIEAVTAHVEGGSPPAVNRSKFVSLRKSVGEALRRTAA